jgi:hypothetical protein
MLPNAMTALATLIESVARSGGVSATPEAYSSAEGGGGDGASLSVDWLAGNGAGAIGTIPAVGMLLIKISFSSMPELQFFDSIATFSRAAGAAVAADLAREELMLASRPPA